MSAFAFAFESAQHFLASSVLVETTCLITDVQMPGLNDLELQEALKAQGYQTDNSDYRLP